LIEGGTCGTSFTRKPRPEPSVFNPPAMLGLEPRFRWVPTGSWLVPTRR
jgi:hypothetical protein